MTESTTSEFPTNEEFPVPRETTRRPEALEIRTLSRSELWDRHRRSTTPPRPVVTTGGAARSCRITWGLVLTVAASGSLGGCARYQTLDLPARPAHSHPNRQENQGLVLAAELLLSPAATDYQFGPELRERGYFPAILFLETRGRSAFELQRDRLRVILENGERFAPQEPMEVIRDLERSYAGVWLTVPLIVPPFFIYRNVKSYNLELARNFLSKALPRSIRMEREDPPQTYAVFFKDPQAEERLPREFASAVLHVPIEVEAVEEAVGKTLTFTLSLSPEETR